MPKRNKKKGRLSKAQKAAAKEAKRLERQRINTAKSDRLALFSAFHDPSAAKPPKMPETVKEHYDYVEKMRVTNKLLHAELDARAKLIRPTIKHPKIVELIDLAVNSAAHIVMYNGQLSRPKAAVAKMKGAGAAAHEIERDRGSLKAYKVYLTSMYEILHEDVLDEHDHLYLLLQYVLIFLKNATFMYLRRVQSDSLDGLLTAFSDMLLLCYLKVEQYQTELMSDKRLLQNDSMPWPLLAEAVHYQSVMQLLREPDNARIKIRLLLSTISDFQIALEGINHPRTFTRADHMICYIADTTGDAFLPNPLLVASLSAARGDDAAKAAMLTTFMSTRGKTYHPSEFFEDMKTHSMHKIGEMSRYFLFTHLYQFKPDADARARRSCGIYDRIMAYTSDLENPLFSDPNVIAVIANLSENLFGVDRVNNWLYQIVNPTLATPESDYLCKLFHDAYAGYEERCHLRDVAQVAIDEILIEGEKNRVITKAAISELSQTLALSDVSSEAISPPIDSDSDSEAESASIMAGAGAGSAKKVKSFAYTSTPEKVYNKVIKGTNTALFELLEVPTVESATEKLSWLSTFNVFHSKYLHKTSRYNINQFYEYVDKIDALYRVAEYEAAAADSNELVVRVNLSWICFLQTCEQFLQTQFKVVCDDPYAPTKRADALVEVGAWIIQAIEFLLPFRDEIKRSTADSAFQVVGASSLYKRVELEGEAVKLLEDRERVKHAIPKVGPRKAFKDWSIKSRKAAAARSSVYQLTQQRERLSIIMAQIKEGQSTPGSSFVLRSAVVGEASQAHDLSMPVPAA